MMKRVILVLDAFTNGHEAALEFILRKGWLISDCEIIFCGTHTKIFERIIEEPSYAVVPVMNSIVGEVTEVAENLEHLREAGYDLLECDRFDLRINHCLLVPQHITRLDELRQVLSHEKAIQQCGNYLDSIGITHGKRSRSDSTGNAARVVARLGSHAKTGAIAPKAAAGEYGLKILAENIQDTEDNKTTFVLLQNEAIVRQVVVGIIGINGRFGQMLKKFFEQLGCSVIGSDERNPTALSNSQVVRRSEGGNLFGSY